MVVDNIEVRYMPIALFDSFRSRVFVLGVGLMGTSPSFFHTKQRLMSRTSQFDFLGASCARSRLCFYR